MRRTLGHSLAQNAGDRGVFWLGRSCCTARAWSSFLPLLQEVSSICKTRNQLSYNISDIMAPCERCTGHGEKLPESPATIAFSGQNGLRSSGSARVLPAWKGGMSLLKQQQSTRRPVACGHTEAVPAFLCASDVPSTIHRQRSPHDGATLSSYHVPARHALPAVCR